MKPLTRDICRRVLLLSLVFAVAWSYFWFPDYEKKQRMQHRVGELKEEIDLLQSRIDYNRERIALLKHDPVTIESEIRQNLRWVRAGESPVEIDGYNE